MFNKLLKQKPDDADKEEDADDEDGAEEEEEEEVDGEEVDGEEIEGEGQEGEEDPDAEVDNEDGAEGAEGDAEVHEDRDGQNGGTSGMDIVTNTFEELHMAPEGVEAANQAWRAFIAAAESREAAGEAIYGALFDSAPSLQSLFVTPRAVQAMKFMTGLSNFVQALEEPAQLKILVETLGFGHLHLDVTVPRVVIFRDAILDILSVELAEGFTSQAREAWTRLLNYVGGAIIYIKANYADRIKTLLESWKVATEGKTAKEKFGDSSDEAGAGAMQKVQESAMGKTMNKTKGMAGMKDEGQGGSRGGNVMSANQVPTTYNEMFRFNSAVMGFGNSSWMGEVLDCFNNIVTNVSNSSRLQEECDILLLRISKVAKGNVNFGEYKSCMLASLRSLLPKDWSTQHEVSWSWLWENVERIMQTNMGSPQKWEKSLGKFLAGLDENQAFEIRKSIYNRFFALAPAGQDFFKQSNTYLHFIAERIMQMTLEIYKDPVKMVDDISALGLRHVGYAIPTEFFGPFVTACVEIIGTVTEDKNAVDAFRWSLGLVSKMLVRTIQEGSTIVMKAINTNDIKQLKKAVSCAPRGERADWLLLVQVGTQSISPLLWSIESGALESAQAIIGDLLIFRADRDRYYYGMDALFNRHPDIVKTLIDDAPTLLPKMLDGLIWRSRTTENGLRRSNYYFKHLLIDIEGKFSSTLAWVAKSKDPRLVCHPVISLLSDTVWSRVACRAFLWRKSWFLLTLLVFIAGQSVLKHLHEGESKKEERYMIFAFRLFIYVLSLTQLMYVHVIKMAKGIHKKEMFKLFGVIPLPKYLQSWQESAGLLLLFMLIGMLVTEPILWCLGHDHGKLFYEDCTEADNVQFIYSLLSMLAMVLYYALLLDLACLSTKVSAYILVCIRMLSEVGLFLLALSAILLAFSSSVSVIKHDQMDFQGIPKGILTLLEVATKMHSGKHYETYESDALVLVCVGLFLISIAVFLLNMLVAQLTCAYEAVYVDMVGYARLERIEIIVGSMPSVSEARWQKFYNSLKLDEKAEFGAGDVGVTGGFQLFEPANANPTTQDMIKRFGGSTAVEQQWPVDTEGDGDEADKFDKIEGLIQKTLKRLNRNGAKGLGGANSGTGSSGHSGQSGEGDGTGDTKSLSSEGNA